MTASVPRGDRLARSLFLTFLLARHAPGAGSGPDGGGAYRERRISV
ncbi:hypothetical protein [Streptomyces fulvorobeus]|uniref:Uncharacterized protein n=1 Tax=Streptomyces fulvorobeus TaxID=284028 RepID=A0A7Y9KVT1_9ACTN|nr:hypothetical protein [Streptomyces fulvorobeus]NYE40077.1 hypothetical protein [Streptomyces fulvorobeus]